MAVVTICGDLHTQINLQYRDPGSILGSGRSLGEGNGNLLQYFCLENPMDKGAWWTAVLGGCKESNMTERLTHVHIHIHVYVSWVTKM